MAAPLLTPEEAATEELVWGAPEEPAANRAWESDPSPSPGTGARRRSPRRVKRPSNVLRPVEPEEIFTWRRRSRASISPARSCLKSLPASRHPRRPRLPRGRGRLRRLRHGRRTGDRGGAEPPNGARCSRGAEVDLPEACNAGGGPGRLRHRDARLHLHQPGLLRPGGRDLRAARRREPGRCRAAPEARGGARPRARARGRGRGAGAAEPETTTRAGRDRAETIRRLEALLAAFRGVRPR